MTHVDTEKYALKHPPGTKPNERIAKAIREKAPGGELACAIGEKISKELKVDISEVGITADLLEMKIMKMPARPIWLGQKAGPWQGCPCGRFGAC